MKTKITTGHAAAFALTATLLWPLQETFGGILMRDHHAAQVVALRYITHLLLLGAFVLPTQGVSALASRRPVLQILRGLCMFGMPAAFIMATDHASIGWIWTVFWLMPALALLGATLLLRERPSWMTWTAVGVGTAGAAVIWDSSPAGLTGTLLALGMSLSFAGYLVFSRMLREERLSTSLFYTGACALLPVSLVVGRVWTPVTASDLIPALITGAISLAILACFDLALEAGAVQLTVPLLTLVPVWEIILAMPLRGMLPDARDMVGAALVALGVVLVIAGQRRMGALRLARAPREAA